MRIAVVSEVSAVDKNGAILSALENRGHEVYNLGMANKGETPELLYTHTGFISALVLNLDLVDLVIGGCGTGQGYLNSVLQYPGVVCGHILNSLDAWLFAQINAGNCIALSLNQGYGWAGDVNLRFIFDSFFSVERGQGYPPERREPQRKAREMLKSISDATHRPFMEIVPLLPKELVKTSLESPRLKEFLKQKSLHSPRLNEALQTWLKY